MSRPYKRILLLFLATYAVFNLTYFGLHFSKEVEFEPNRILGKRRF